MRGPNRKPFERHGEKSSAEYSVWAGMIRRCENPNDKTFPRYGARGIKVHSRWRNSFVAFLSDMGRRPPGTWLDRIDGTKGYEPGNCRWATPTEQQRNRSNNRLLTFRGRTACMSEWAADRGMTIKNLWHRLSRGWTVKRALTQPLRSWP